MAASLSISPLPSPPLPPLTSHHRHLHLSPTPLHLRRSPPAGARLRESRRRPHDAAVVVVPDPRAWVGDFSGADATAEEGDETEEENEEEEEEEDRSLDLLVRFLHTVFRKVSRRARRAARSVLPPSVSAKLVKFSVNGVLILAFLWILKGLIEVICTFGTMVFVSILLVRGVWSGVTYIRENQYNYIRRIDDDDRIWSGVQTAG